VTRPTFLWQNRATTTRPNIELPLDTTRDDTMKDE
jgi:hypothetical protein